MNERDRKRWADLVRAEYGAKRSDLSKDPTAAEMAAAKKQVIADLGIAKRIAELKKAEKRCDELRSTIGELLRRLLPKSSRWMHHDIDKLIDAAANERLRGAEHQAKKAALFDAERRMLARVEAAESLEELRAIGRECGLLREGGAK